MSYDVVMWFLVWEMANVVPGIGTVSPPRFDVVS